MDNSFKSNIGDEIEKKNKLEYEAAIARSGMTPEKIAELKSTLKKDKHGKYIFNKKKPYGSIENPVVVGMPDCSDSLIYDWRKDRWILTDGLGNGWIR